MTKVLFIWRKVGPGAPRANFTARVHGKNVSRVMISCSSQGTKISACACSAWRDLARLGELRLAWNRLHDKSWLDPQGHPTPRARFAVSHVNGYDKKSVHGYTCSQTEHKIGLHTLLPTKLPILGCRRMRPVWYPARKAAWGMRSTYTWVFSICASTVATMRTFASANRCRDCPLTRLCTFS